MNRIIIALFALAFMHLASSQLSACDQAQLDLTNDPDCVVGGIGAIDAPVVCMGSCRSLIDNVISNCDNTVSSKVLIGYWSIAANL